MLRSSVLLRVFPAVFAALLVLGAPNVSAQKDEPVLVMGGADGVEKLDTSTVADMSADADPYELLGTAAQDGLTFRILSKDPDGQGFRDATLGAARLECVRKALLYIADVLNTTGELNLMLGASQYDGTGPLAESGTLFPVTPGYTNGTAFLTLAEGSPHSPESAEIALVIDWGYAWYLGDGFPPTTQFDLRSVVLHEVTHGLGFISLLSATGESRGKPNVYSVFDSFLRRSGTGEPMVDNPALPVFTGTAADLTGGALVFGGPNATAAYGSSPFVNTPGTFAAGTSLQHWDQSSVGNAVMNPRYSSGVVQRAYTYFEVNALKDLGYAGAAQGDHNDACPLTSVAFVAPVGDSVAAGAAGTAVVNFRASVGFGFTNSQCLIEHGGVHVDYWVDGTATGSSEDEVWQFPVDLTLAAGSHTVTAVARLLALDGEVRVEKTVTVATPAPALRVSPGDTAYAFQDLKTNQTASHSFTVGNAGGGTLTGSASLAGNSAFQFSGASTYSLAAGQTATVTVTFAPPAKGDYSGTVSFGGNGGSFAVAITGKGLKNTSLFSCAGLPGSEPWSGMPEADMAVVLLAASALLLARRRAAKR